MSIIFPLAVFAGLVGLGLLWRPSKKKARTATRNDMLRAGSSGETSPEDAALRAQGKVAWMRMTGF